MTKKEVNEPSVILLESSRATGTLADRVRSHEASSLAALVPIAGLLVFVGLFPRWENPLPDNR